MSCGFSMGNVKTSPTRSPGRSRRRQGRIRCEAADGDIAARVSLTGRQNPSQVSRSMRLLDRVARYRAPFALALDHHPSASFEVTGPSGYAASVTDCPLRFVLGDDLTRACAELAFADGARLAGCLDLLRVPARHLWIEWNDEVHKRVIYETQSAADYDSASIGRRVGVLMEGSPD